MTAASVKASPPPDRRVSVVVAALESFAVLGGRVTTAQAAHVLAQLDALQREAGSPNELARRIDLALSESPPLTGEACRHGWDRAVCSMTECSNPYAFEPLLKEAAEALRARSGSDARAEAETLPTDEGGCVTKRFVIFTTPGRVPEKKGGWLKDDHLIDFLRDVMLHDGWEPGFRATVLELTWNNDLWASSAAEYLTMHDDAIGPRRARTEWREAREKYECIYGRAPAMKLGTEIRAFRKLTEIPTPATPAGWIVSNANGDRWRTWEGGFSAWTDDREKATRYARREDAEAVHAEDEDAWRIEPYGPATPAGEELRLLERFGRDTCLELSFGYDPDEEGDPGAWMVHRVNGGRSDREWTLIGKGDTPQAAILAALEPQAEGRE